MHSPMTGAMSFLIALITFKQPIVARHRHLDDVERAMFCELSMSSKSTLSTYAKPCLHSPLY